MSKSTLDEEGILDPEDLKRLNQILAIAQKATKKAYEKIPKIAEGIEEFTIETNIQPDLRDDEPDRLIVLIKLTIIFQKLPFKISSTFSKAFYVECLDKNIEKAVEQKFTETVNETILTFCNFLYGGADTLLSMVKP